MMKIVYASTKEVIRISYPNWCHIFMRFLWKHLEVKSVKTTNGSKIDRVILNKWGYFPPVIIEKAVELTKSNIKKKI